MRTQEKIIQIVLASLLAGFTLAADAQDQVPGSEGAADSAASNVSGPSTGQTPRAANRKLVKRVSEVLDRTKGLDSSRIMVTAHDGIVTLSGSIPDSSQAMLAASSAQTVDGVQAVRNQLRITTQGW